MWMVLPLLPLYPQSSNHARNWTDTCLLHWPGNMLNVSPALHSWGSSPGQTTDGSMAIKEAKQAPCTLATSTGPLSTFPTDVYHPIWHTCNPGCDVRYVQITLCIAGMERTLNWNRKYSVIRTLREAFVLEYWSNLVCRLYPLSITCMCVSCEWLLCKLTTNEKWNKSGREQPREEL